MPRSRLPLRLILLAALAIGIALLLGLFIGALNGLLEFYQRLTDLPLWLRLPLILAVALALLALVWLLWRILGPGSATPRRSREPPTRAAVEARVDDLRRRQAETAALEQELAELDRRHASGEIHVALFGEISTGKSSLIRALAPEAAPDVDVRGGTTRAIGHYRGRLANGRDLVLADVPGTGEIDGQLRERLAREEALRAHVVVYLSASDLSRAQATEIDWLADFGKPLVLALNKMDLFGPEQRDALLHKLSARLRGRVDAIVAISAGGGERYERTLADGRVERVERERTPDVAALTAALQRLAGAGAETLEPARQAALLASIDARGDELARAAASRESDAAVTRYTRRAIVGALAAVLPGSDILIQGALGTALVRELARIHDIPVRDIDVDALLGRLGLTVRNTSAVVLAIAGNALKAFPGLGTLGGGVLHAIAYGLVFDSVGHALAATLAERATLDAADAERRVRVLLAQPARERVERVARLVLDVARNGTKADD
ncbi:MAG TPA: GTPase [Rhodanobacteraceae bacterium]|nr:GTPase [Rhodanobacteraceae bacterium]